MKNSTLILNALLLLGLSCLASLAQAQPSTLQPLNQQEFNAVIEEIQVMVKTKEEVADAFVVRQATPEKIEWLYNMPELLQQPTIIRENGLIFAGQGALLSFNKPSDIIAKIAAWFPAEIAKTRIANARGSFDFVHQHINLFGPFPSWQAEPTAFVALWKCMPENVWRHPQQNPFLLPLGQGSFFAIADTSSGQFNFSNCVHERAGYLPSWTQATAETYKKAALEIGNKAAPIVQRKFADYLSAHRCQGTGPDDCVLLLMLWNSLSPTDPKLAKMIQTLETDVAHSATLPPVSPNVYPRKQAQLENVSRQATFLRLKQLSIAHAPSTWSPSQALSTTLPQMANLFQYDDNISFVIGETPAEQSAMSAELERLLQQSACSTIRRWLNNVEPALQARFALKHLPEAKPNCWISPNWDWLKKGESAVAKDLRNDYLKLLGHDETGALHELLLANLTDDGKACFEKTDTPQPAWQAALCQRWIAEPQNVSLQLPHSHLNLDQAKQIKAVPLTVPQMNANQAHGYDAWLNQLVVAMDAGAQQKMQAFIAEINHRQGFISNAFGWQQPKLGVSVVELQLTINKPDESIAWPFEGWRAIPYESSRLLLVFDGSSFTVVGVPLRLLGDHEYKSMVHISDVDEDGNLEVWLSAAFRECRGDDSDLQRELDCSAKTATMGEIWGNALTHFANSPKQRTTNANQAKKPAWLALAMPVGAPSTEAQICNTQLLRGVLSQQLDIDYGGTIPEGEHYPERGDVIALVCKPHPVNKEQTIVALFYDLKNDKGDLLDGQKGFALAVVNLQHNKLVRLYRETIEEDATTRIDGGSLNIDTARYNLATGVRAIGVRMNTGYSPHCAEGGWNNFLSLFVEENNSLRLVLKNLAMSTWAVVDGSNGCGYGNEVYSTDTVELSLAVADSTSHGWHDLEITEHHQLDRNDPTSDQYAVPVKTATQVKGKLRFNGKEYSTDAQ